MKKKISKAIKLLSGAETLKILVFGLMAAISGIDVEKKASEKRKLVGVFKAIPVLLLLTSGMTLIADAKYYNYDVPYLKQLDNPDIGESACAPTSMAMLLRYYFPNSGIDVPEIYHSGIQGYAYDGPAVGYKNVGFASGDTGLTIVGDFKKYYVGDYSGLRSPNAAAQYLNQIWGGKSYGGSASFQKVIDEIKERPLAVGIHYNNNPDIGHYVVLRGYDDAGTPDDYSDDKFYVNDPYTKWVGHPNGENRQFTYATLSSWYSGRIITFEPTLSELQRKYTVVTDTNKVQLDDIGVKDEAGE